MSLPRFPRWTALLVLPLLAGALLLMHGLDAGASTSGRHGAAASVPAHSHGDEVPAEHGRAGCDSCATDHVISVCVAIVAAVVGLRLARRAAAMRLTTVTDAGTDRIRTARRLLRAPDPAWVRLAVMRC